MIQYIPKFKPIPIQTPELINYPGLFQYTPNIENAIWSPFERSSALILEEQFKMFQKKGSDFSKVIIGNYSYDFNDFMQTNIQDPFRRRFIKYDFPHLIPNMERHNRFYNDSQANYSNFGASNTFRWMTLDDMTNNMNNNLYFSKVTWKVFSNLQFKVPNQLDFFKGEVLGTLEKYVENMTNEINNLECNTNYDEYLNKIIDNETFCQQIFLMYTVEGPLYKYLNKSLRSKKGRTKIKFFYTAMMAAFEYFSNRSWIYLIIDNKISKMDDFLLVYRGHDIDEEQIKEYQQKIEIDKNIEFNEAFLSTSMIKEKAMCFMNKNSQKMQAIFKIKLFLRNKNEFAYLKYGRLSVFPEDEILLKSGTHLKIIRTKEINDGTYHISAETVPLDFHESSFFSKIKPFAQDF